MVFNSDTKTFEGMLFDLPGRSTTSSKSGGVRSDVFTMNVVDLPYVQQLELEYPSRPTPASRRARSKTAATSPCCSGTEVASQSRRR